MTQHGVSEILPEEKKNDVLNEIGEKTIGNLLNVPCR